MDESIKPHRLLLRRRLKVAAVAIVASSLLGVAAIGNASVATPAEGFAVVLSDDFTGAQGALPDAGIWDFDLGKGYPGGPDNWGTGEIQTYTKDAANIGLDGQGNLLITPQRQADGTWTSARIETKRADITAPDGGVLRVEARLQLPDTSGGKMSGYWPAFWMLGSPYRGNFQNWPSVGEIDVMENVNGHEQVFGTVHCGVNPGGPCQETTGLAGRTDCGGSCQGGFHTYAVEWDRTESVERMRWSVDGDVYHEVTEDQVPADTWTNAFGHEGFFLLLNVAMGGAFPDAISDVPTPAEDTIPGRPLVVDYVSASIKN